LAIFNIFSAGSGRKNLKSNSKHALFI
jgi:hypothetical protein